MFAFVLTTNVTVPPPLPTYQPLICKINSNGKIDQAVNEKGQATEMLSQSIQKLKLSENKDKIFKSEAGKIIAGMLEARLNEKNISQTKANNLNAISSLESYEVKNASDKTAALPKIMTKPAINKKPDISFNVPNIQIKSELSSEPIRNNATIQKPISDFNDNNILEFVQKRNGLNNEYVNDSSLQLTVSPADHHNLENEKNSVVFRNKNMKAELTTHARDRRSYIEKDLQIKNQNMFNNNIGNHLITSHTTDNANESIDGKYHICSVCNIEITK